MPWSNDVHEDIKIKGKNNPSKAFALLGYSNTFFIKLNTPF